MRRLRTFDPSRGAALLSWLTVRLSQLIYERAQKESTEPEVIPLDEAKDVPAVSDAVARDFPEPTLLRVEDVARRWGLDRKTVYGMIERGEISARRCGRLVRIPRKMVESFESQARAVPERI